MRRTPCGGDPLTAAMRPLRMMTVLATVFFASNV
jgi:hypothetical protein